MANKLNVKLRGKGSYGYVNRVIDRNKKFTYAEKHLYGQAVRKGLQPSTIQKAAEKVKARRPALHKEHRPSGQKLRRNSESVAHYHQRKECRYLCN